MAVLKYVKCRVGRANYKDSLRVPRVLIDSVNPAPSSSKVWTFQASWVITHLHPLLLQFLGVCVLRRVKADSLVQVAI